MAGEERLRGLLVRAGFAEVRVEELPARFAFEDLDDYFGLVRDSNAQIGAVLDGLSADELAAVATKVESGFEPFRADGGYELSGVALGAVAS